MNVEWYVCNTVLSLKEKMSERLGANLKEMYVNNLDGKVLTEANYLRKRSEQ